MKPVKWELALSRFSPPFLEPSDDVNHQFLYVALQVFTSFPEGLFYYISFLFCSCYISPFRYHTSHE